MRQLKSIVNRQIHLDFHTNGLISDVAADFDAGEFVQTIKEAHVGSVCIFARCHHGYCYYPTRVGTVHPQLKEPDLLGKQLLALNEAGISTALYTTICWDELSAAQHPEWICMTPENKIMKFDPKGQEMGRFEPGWTFLCWNSPYRDFLRSHIIELLHNYKTDFIFLDILFTMVPCVCGHCVVRMNKFGLDPLNSVDRENNSIDSAREFMAFINEAIASINPEILPFYNSRLRVTGEVERGSVPEMQYLGMLEIESLPSGPWGYDHFPLFAKYFQNFDIPTIGMTGKFQKFWGDFGGIKNQAALDYEVGRIVAHGGFASVGDQLHPRGTLDKATYDLIGNTFSKIEPIEQFLIPSVPIDEIGVLLTNRPKFTSNLSTEMCSENGIMKMLMQLHYQYSFIDETSDFNRYKLLILPDHVLVNETFRCKLNAYIANGGKVLASYEGGMDAQGRLAIDVMPLTINKDLEFTPHYFYPVDVCHESKVIANTDHVQYHPGKNIEVSDGKIYKSLCNVTEPYFNRRWDQFCSHVQTPPDRRTNKSEILFNGSNVIYFASEIFACYEQHAPRVLKQLVDHAIKLLMHEKIICSNLPSTAEVTFRKNSFGNHVLTILHYVHQRRGKGLDIVEDVIPLHNVEMSIICAEKSCKVFDRTANRELLSTYKAGRIEFTIPMIEGFVVITIENFRS